MGGEQAATVLAQVRRGHGTMRGSIQGADTRTIRTAGASCIMPARGCGTTASSTPLTPGGSWAGAVGDFERPCRADTVRRVQDVIAQCSVAADRQSRRNRLPDRAHRAAHGYRERSRFIPRPTKGPACASGRQGRAHRRSAGSGQLSQYRRHHRSGACQRGEAIHPGYGFLSENADICGNLYDAGIVFVGPPAEAMRAMGSKVRGQDTDGKRRRAGVVRLSWQMSRTTDFSARQAARVGYPVMIKAVSGGGGRGMRIVAAADEFALALSGTAGSGFRVSAMTGC